MPFIIHDNTVPNSVHSSSYTVTITKHVNAAYSCQYVIVSKCADIVTNFKIVILLRVTNFKSMYLGVGGVI